LKKGADLIVAVCHRVENMDVGEIRPLVHKLVDARGMNAFALGGLLQRINLEKQYLQYGFDSFKEFVETEVGISKSTAYAHAGIYHNLIESGVSWEQVRDIGWTKLRIIVAFLTEKNAAKWIEVATAMNAVELREYTKQQVAIAQKAAAAPKYVADCDAEVSTQVEISAANDEDFQLVENPPLVTEEAADKVMQKKSYIFHSDQLQLIESAIEKAKKESETEYDSVALTNICMFYLTG
jgi:hypothetical protein